MAQGEKIGPTLSRVFKKAVLHTAIIAAFGVAALYTGVDFTGAVSELAQGVWGSVVGAPAVT